MIAQPETQHEHQAPGSPPSVCWMLDLKAHGAAIARAMHPISDAADQQRRWVPDPDVFKRRATD